MATLYTEREKNSRRTWVFMALFFALVGFIGWIFSYVYSNPSIFYVALLVSVLMNVTSYWFSDKIVISLTGAKPVQKNDNPMLFNVVENLSITAGLPMPKLYIINDSSPNAFATGRNKEHSAVAVTTGLLSMLNRAELEGVIAHELAHIGNRDTLIATVTVVLAGLVAMLSDMFLRSRLIFNSDNDRNGRSNALVAVLGIVAALLAPLIATVIRLAVSRKREFMADASGALLTRYPEGLASALKKISTYAQPMRRASNATAHLFIANPFGAERTRKISFLEKIFSTHPPAEERIKALLQDRVHTI
jgi:heat shock protein HtpX